jgi:peptidase M23-like protein
MGKNTLGGRIVLIAGAGDRRYYYAHLEAFAADLRVGTYVTPETLIGTVGTTGNAARTPPHLHFAVYTIGGAINPLPMLQDRVPDSSVGLHKPGYSLLDMQAGTDAVRSLGWRPLARAKQRYS